MRLDDSRTAQCKQTLHAGGSSTSGTALWRRAVAYLIVMDEGYEDSLFRFVGLECYGPAPSLIRAPTAPIRPSQYRVLVSATPDSYHASVPAAQPPSSVPNPTRSR
eukprot:3281104-Rhodomonas_salina.2